MIGVFDSGLGGLTILKAFLKRLPQYDYVYLGDSARTPYGDKSQDVIYNYTREAVDFLFKKGCEIVIVACNTASAKALRKIQREWLPKEYSGRRVLGVLIPVAEAAVEEVEDNKKKNKIGIIGTRATIESGVYEKEINKLRPGLEIYNQACPLLVPLVEEGWIKKRETKMILRKYLRKLKLKKIDILILGCTHYPVLYKEIQSVMGKQCRVLNSPEIVAQKLANYLKRHLEIDEKIGKNKKRFFYTTDDVNLFKNFGEKFLGEEIKSIEKMEL